MYVINIQMFKVYLSVKLYYTNISCYWNQYWHRHSLWVHLSFDRYTYLKIRKHLNTIFSLISIIFLKIFYWFFRFSFSMTFCVYQFFKFYLIIAMFLFWMGGHIISLNELVLSFNLVKITKFFSILYKGSTFYFIRCLKRKQGPQGPKKLSYLKSLKYAKIKDKHTLQLKICFQEYIKNRD